MSNMKQKMRLLELYSGTGSIGAAFERIGWDVVSLDIEAKFEPTHVVNIHDWDYRQYPPNHFQFVWASPPCQNFSRCRSTGGPRDITGACANVARALEIMHYFGAPMAMENPRTGLLKRQAVIEGIPYKDVTYCMYGFPYRKPTRIWTTLGDYWAPRRECFKATPCPHLIDQGKHPCVAQRGSVTVADNLPPVGKRQQTLYIMPPALCDEIAQAADAMCLAVNGPNPAVSAESIVPEAQIHV